MKTFTAIFTEFVHSQSIASEALAVWHTLVFGAHFTQKQYTRIHAIGGEAWTRRPLVDHSSTSAMQRVCLRPSWRSSRAASASRGVRPMPTQMRPLVWAFEATPPLHSVRELILCPIDSGRDKHCSPVDLRDRRPRAPRSRSGLLPRAS